MISETITPISKAKRDSRTQCMAETYVLNFSRPWSSRKVAEEYAISYSLAKKLCEHLKNENYGKRKLGYGRPRKTVREDRYVIREAVKMRKPSEPTLCISPTFILNPKSQRVKYVFGI